MAKTDIGDLDTDGGSEGQGEGTDEASEGEDSSGSDLDTSAGSTSPAECAADDDCSDGCCPGFACDFATQCDACTPAGEVRGVDGAGCCDLSTTPAMLCYEPTCDDDGCPPDVAACAGLVALHSGDQFAIDCPPEACLGSRTLALTNAEGEPGLECTGPGGSSECQATDGALQQYSYDSGDLLLTIRFDAAVLTDYSTAGFNAAFDSVAGQLTIPDASVPIVAFVETASVSPLVYDNGRLQLTLTLTLDSAFTTIESDEVDCLSDDIAGECSCFYEALGTFEVVVDLDIEAP